MDLSARLKPRQLRLLLKIAETRQLQVAAAAMALSQPAASRLLAQVEAQIGAALFHRHPKGMEPTQVGAAVLRHARVILSEMDSLAAEVENLRSGAAGEVRVGSVTGPTVGALVPAIRAVKAESPGLAASIEVGPSAQLIRGLEEGRFDFVMARLPPGQDSRLFRIHPARAEIVSFLVRAGHPMLGAPRGLAELRGYEWVIQERGTPVRQAVEGAFHAAGLEVPGDIINSSSLLVVLSVLEGTDAIAPQSQEVAELLLRGAASGAASEAGYAAIELEESISVTPYFIIQRREQQMPRAAERVLEEVFRRL